MKGRDAELAELRATVARLERELSRLNAQNAMPRAPRDGSWIVKPDSSISKGSSGACSVYAGEVDTTINVTAKALGAAVVSAKWCIAWIDRAGKWYVAPWECS